MQCAANSLRYAVTFNIHIPLQRECGNGVEYWVPSAEVESADCILVMYSIVDRASLGAAQLILGQVDAITRLTRPPLTLLANKMDLDHCRQVTPEV